MATMFQVSTQTALGHMIFKTRAAADAFVAEAAEFGDEGETFEVRDYQGGRHIVARFYNGEFEAYC